MRLGFLISLTIIAGCAATPPAVQQPSQARLSEAFSRASAQAQAGNYAGAATAYEEARRIARSIEDADDIAAAAINLSIVYQRLGREPQAREALAEVLDQPRHAFPERRVMQAELRRAILALAAADAGAATEWAARAERRCGSCELAPAILNVRAQAALQARNVDEAGRLAGLASDAARSRNDRAESANALRTLGRVKIAQKDPGAATAALEQALDLDHGLADPRKIAADLAELARAHAAAGNTAVARNYFERALSVSRALNDARAVAEIEAQMASAGGPATPVNNRK